MVGGIYLAKIYFTDLSDFKIRPVLVLKQNQLFCIETFTAYIIIDIFGIFTL